MKLVSLSIADGSDRNMPLNDSLPLRDRETWFPDIPDPHLAVVGMDRPQNHHHRPTIPITLARFQTSPETLQRIRRLTLQTTRNGKLCSLDVTYGHNEECIRLGLDVVEATQYSSFDFDYAAGEEIVGIEVFYHTSGWQVGFKVALHLPKPPGPLSESSPNVE